VKISLVEVGVGTLAMLMAGAAIQGSVGQVAPDEEAKAQQSTCLRNLRSLGLAFQLYVGDFHDVAPLSVPNANGQYAPLRQFPAPIGQRYEPMGSGWVHALRPYTLDKSVFVCPASKKLEVEDSQVGQSPRVLETSYAYNGLLHALNAAKFVAPAELTTFWEGWGDTFDPRYYGANPQLNCHDGSPPCVYAGVQGPTSIMFQPHGTLWIHNSGFNSAFADTHTKWTRVGAQVTPGSAGPPYTDYRVDPFTGYDDKGIPGWYWQHNLHPLIFAPDFDFDWRRHDAERHAIPVPQTLKRLSAN
jgi:hypothetical protein